MSSKTPSTTLDASATEALLVAIAALQSIVATAPEAPSAPAAQAPLTVAPEVRRNAAGRLVDAKGKFVAEPKAPVAEEKPSEFVAWLRETAEQRAERKVTNRELAAKLRAADIEPKGLAWEMAKAGKSIRSIKAALKKADATA